jgi:hypothetical protein
MTQLYIVDKLLKGNRISRISHQSGKPLGAAGSGASQAAEKPVGTVSIDAAP